MYKYIIRRILLLIPVLLGVCFVIFLMLEITPGDPVAQILGGDATEEAVAALRTELGLDQPFFSRFFKYIFDAVRGDFGISYSTKQPIATELMQRFPTTLLFATLCSVISATVGIILGTISATRQYSLFDNIARFFALLGVSVPTFWMGLMAVLLFSLRLGWFPSSGFYGPIYWVLPSVTIGLVQSASIMRMTRSSMLEVVRQDYIRTARAKGQSEWNIITKHALLNALIPVITVLGIQFGHGLGGAVVTEQVFSIPGIGKLMVDAIKTRNYPLVQGGVLLIAVSFSVVNLAIDILYALIDPRIKSQYGSKSKKKAAKEKSEVTT